MKVIVTLAFAATAVVASLTAGGVDAAEASAPVTVEVEHNGDNYVATVVMIAPADRSIAWDVLSDFDHMTEFLPNLTSSRVLQRDGDRLLVQQSGRMEFGAVRMPWQSDREVQLTPQTVIHSRQLRGNMQRVESVARFSDVPGGTRVDYRVEMVPKLWMPESVAAPMMRDSMERQFSAMRDEIIKRKP
jgi:ribosome-associated toxin RatA of RatAB toxin-antitoxin module